MTKAIQSQGVRYVEIVEHGNSAHPHKLAALDVELIALRDVHVELSCTRISILLGARYRRAERMLEMLLTEGRVSRMKCADTRGPQHYFWSACRGTSCAPVRYNGTSILTAFQQSVAVRS